MTFEEFVKDLSQEEIKALKQSISDDIHSNTPEVKTIIKNVLRKLETAIKAENKMKRE